MLAFLRTIPGALTALCGLSLLASLFPGAEKLAFAAVAFGAYGALKSAADSIREREIDVNLLMVLAAIGAIMVGRPDDAAILLFLFSLSGALEQMAMARTKNAIEGLIRLRPSEAIRLVEGREERVKVESLVLGDLIRVPPFDPIPVDGVVTEGTSAVDSSAMTGESREVPVSAGAKVIGGTRNLSGAFVLEVRSTVGDSTLDKIVALVESAQENKASGERLSTWFGQRYTILVLVAFVISLGVRSGLGEMWGTAFYASLTLLVALSPCALVISTPASTLSALAYAARNGILVRGGEFIELAGTVNTLALDKTGTLTVGQPRLTEICVCSAVAVTGSAVDGMACWHGDGALSEDSREFLRSAAAVETHSGHPIALAVLEAARQFSIEPLPVENLRAVPGLGVVGEVAGRRVAVGQLGLLQTEGVRLPADFLAHVDDLQARGVTVALIADGDRLAALGFADKPREEAAKFLEEARALGVKNITMLTGDTPQTAALVAARVGITDVRAGLLPAEKTDAIAKLVAEGKQVMMIGDGVNDAPALAQASVGVAMGGLGSDIAMNAADVVLMHDRLDRIPLLIRLGRLTNRTIRTNLLFASGVIIVLTIFSLLGRLPLPLAVVGHEGSTVLVILNGLRLLNGPKSAKG